MGISGGIKIAVGGATGNVGSEMLRLLERRGFPASEVIPLASAASGGRSINFRGEQISVRDLATFEFSGTDFYLLLLGPPIRGKLARKPPQVATSSVTTLAFRMDPAVPLVVPEVNMQHLDRWQERRILPVANCSTIQLVVALKRVHDAAKRVVIATYQYCASGGRKMIDSLLNSFCDAPECPPGMRRQRVRLDAPGRRSCSMLFLI